MNQIPVVPLVNPLTSDDLATLQQAVAKSKEHADIIARLQAAGVPVDDHAARNQMHSDVAQALIKQFFPTNLSPPAHDE